MSEKTVVFLNRLGFGVFVQRRGRVRGLPVHG